MASGIQRALVCRTHRNPRYIFRSISTRRETKILTLNFQLELEMELVTNRLKSQTGNKLRKSNTFDLYNSPKPIVHCILKVLK